MEITNRFLIRQYSVTIIIFYKAVNSKSDRFPLIFYRLKK